CPRIGRSAGGINGLIKEFSSGLSSAVVLIPIVGAGAGKDWKRRAAILPGLFSMTHWRNSGVSTTVRWDRPVLWRRPSYDPKKKSSSLSIGPPTANPN